MGLENGIEIDLSERILKNGKAIAAIPIAVNNDKKEIKTDSVKNCLRLVWIDRDIWAL